MNTKTPDINDYPELQQNLARAGFAKVAARMYGVDALDERAVASLLGTKLARQHLERKTVRRGLDAMARLLRDEVK